ncbi:FAD/NAD(P)-binding domain-containing protein [Pholiota conissans]|uniref:FAD/NAD(P)-binding domain-containing protein n=1 Tax=Pholiota conissans TaxID=109636 RepID=A0A9P5ZCT2_9AGAR|nr:FAD/NAD(P)-binding domain-containing protein [Pholiota conissans]
MSDIPAHTTVLVIGGGPSGAYTASVLANEGVQVTVLEAAQFPRYHIGESMLPSINSFYNFIGAEEKLRKFGFCPKPGAAVKLQRNKKEAYTNFIERNEHDASYNVVRSQLDELLLRHSQECGAAVFEQTRVNDIVFDEKTVDTDKLRPIGANYTREGKSGYITFDYLVDSSGSRGIMSTKYLKNRKMNQTLHNIACWGYWSGQGTYMPGTYRHNAPWFEALSDESGWAWFIPLHDGTVSVGFVMDKAISISKKAALRESNPDEYSLKAHYLDQLQYTPGLRDLLKNATMKESEEAVKSASDYSYSASSYAGDHFRLVGDAAAFIDPFFSSGCHLAHLGGLSAGMTICASIKKDCTEEEAIKYHDIKIATSYTRFLIVVLSAYKQIRSQVNNVLADIDEDNYDRAFDFFRPIIQGTADVGKQLTEDELQKTIDYCTNIFLPSDPELRESVGNKIGFDALKASNPVLNAEEIEKIGGPDEDVVMVLKHVNARKPLVGLYEALDVIKTENIGGFVARLKRGELGLTPEAKA